MYISTYNTTHYKLCHISIIMKHDFNNFLNENKN